MNGALNTGHLLLWRMRRMLENAGPIIPSLLLRIVPFGLEILGQLYVACSYTQRCPNQDHVEDHNTAADLHRIKA